MGFVDKLRTMGMTDGEKLYLFATDGFNELDRNYKKTSIDGKLEVLIFNILILLKVYENKYPEKIEETKSEIDKRLNTVVKKIFPKSDDDFIYIFLYHKTSFYNDEIENIYNSKEYLLNNIYNVFYISPLKNEPCSTIDLGELLVFRETFFNMINTITKAANEI